MYPIKFKAWDTKLKKWSTAFMGLSEKGALIFRSPYGDSSKPLLIYPEDSRCKLVVYTGKQDVDDNPIYSDDILEYFGLRKVVGWNDKDANWALKNTDPKYQKYVVQLATVDLEKSKVIGNIYENPELLREQA